MVTTLGFFYYSTSRGQKQSANEMYIYLQSRHSTKILIYIQHFFLYLYQNEEEKKEIILFVTHRLFKWLEIN